MTRVCRREARLALMSAALRAAAAREKHDAEAAAVWRDRADYARDLLREACGDLDGLRFYLGVHRPRWLEQVPPDVPLFVSRTTFPRTKLPRAAGPWALDSGGFTELSRKGSWTITEREYAREVRRLRDEVGLLEWAAPMDWMCEPGIIHGDARLGWPGTGLTVEEHQRRTVANFLALRDELGRIVAPVLQGWEPDDYLRCVEMYAAAGVSLPDEPRVGVGSVCRRQGTADAARVFRSLHALGIRAHGFGVKTTGLELFSDALGSADSMAWSYDAHWEAMHRRKHADRRGLDRDHPDRFGACGKRSCANCLHRALEWRSGLLAKLERVGQQQRMEVSA